MCPFYIVRGCQPLKTCVIVYWSYILILINFTCNYNATPSTMPMKKWPYKRGDLSLKGQFSSILLSEICPDKRSGLLLEYHYIDCNYNFS